MKQEFGPTTIIRDLEHHVLIAPVKTNELIAFLDNFKVSEYNDEICKQYSTDNNYQVYFYITEVSRSAL